jgi:hypothetical protein
VTLVTLNSWMAGAIALVSLGSIACMNGTTCHAVRLAILALLIGGAGQALGFAFSDWDHYLDTILYAGILALLVSNRRGPKWIPSTWSPLLAIGVLLFAVAVLAAVLVSKT